MGNLDALDKVSLLLSVRTDCLPKVAAEDSRYTVKINGLEQFYIIRMDDDTMSIETTQSFWGGSFF